MPRLDVTEEELAALAAVLRWAPSSAQASSPLLDGLYEKVQKAQQNVHP